VSLWPQGQARVLRQHAGRDLVVSSTVAAVAVSRAHLCWRVDAAAMLDESVPLCTADVVHAVTSLLHINPCPSFPHAF
jgi:hypothetical protein